MRTCIRSWILAATLLGVACPKSAELPVRAAPTGPARSIFDDGFAFACSPQKEIGCKGLFAPRRSDGSEVAILASGQDALAVRIASLKAAKRSIRIQALIFRGDEAGLFIAKLLKAKKKAGLEVRVIVDAASNLDWQTQWMYFDLKQHGVEVEGYEALYLQWITAEKLMEPWRANKRFHDKMWITDGDDASACFAIVGGLNIANTYFRVADRSIDRWHDQDVALHGPIVADVVEAFDRNYDFFKKIKTRLPGRFNPDNSWRLARKVLGKLKKVRLPSWRDEHLAALVQREANRTVALDFSPMEARFLQSRPRFQETFIHQAYVNLIDGARDAILVANAYFIPSREMISAFKRAARRGVRVVILTNSPETNDIASVALVSRYIYKDLLEVNLEEDIRGSVEIREWRGPEMDEGTLHAKYAVFDASVAIVGSYNLDPRSERLNSETAIALRGQKAAGDLARHFEASLLPKSRKILWKDVEAYRRPEHLGKKFELLFSLSMKRWL